MYIVRSLLPSPFDSIRDAVFTVSPNKQYLGILRPTTPATTEPSVQQNSKKKFKMTVKSSLNLVQLNEKQQLHFTCVQTNAQSKLNIRSMSYFKGFNSIEQS